MSFTSLHCAVKRTSFADSGNTPSNSSSRKIRKTTTIPTIDLDTNISPSKPILRSPPSLIHLPAEIRLEICNCVLAVNQVPTSYAYIPPKTTRGEDKDDQVDKAPTFLKHGLVLTSRQLSAEYRQAFYERTRFFLHIDSSNAFDGLPTISSFRLPTSVQSALGEPSKVSVIPNFWNAPDKLLASLRHCTLFIEIGNIASARESTHSFSKMVRANKSYPEAKIVRGEMKAFTSFAAIKEQDAVFDATLLSSIQALIAHMVQLRSIHIVWETRVQGGRRLSFSKQSSTDWSWRALGQPFVGGFQGRRNLRMFQVKVGDGEHDGEVKGRRGEGGEWVLSEAGLSFLDGVAWV